MEVYGVTGIHTTTTNKRGHFYSGRTRLDRWEKKITVVVGDFDDLFVLVEFFFLPIITFSRTYFNQRMPESIMIDYSSDEDAMPLAARVAKDGVQKYMPPEVAKKSIKRPKKIKAEDTGDGPAKKRTKSNSNDKANGSSVSKRDGESKSSKSKKESKSKQESKSKKETKPKKEPKPKKGRKPKDEDDSKAKSEEPEEDELFRWWEVDNDNDGSMKWTTLEHNGVLLPPPYELLPKSVKLVYDGKDIDLAPEAEEVAGFFGAMLNSDHVKNPTFQKNFFGDFLEVVKSSGGASVSNTKKPIELKSFEKCDFRRIFDFYENQRAERKALPAAEKKKLKADKDKFEEKYKSCMLDGRKQPVGNFRIEPPGLFRGRGAHPKTGKLKARVKPEQIIINIGKEAAVPQPPEGHQWAEVRNDNTVSWLAMWRENINGSFKYVFLAHNSSLKGMSDFKKFEKARELKQHVGRIRADYTKELRDELMINRQRATAMYLIDVLALRAGGEKGDDEADTVGCCSLRYEHITLTPPNTVVFDFLGKDSIRYFQEVQVDAQVFKNLMIFKRAPKGPGDDIFDRLDPGILNRHLQNYMTGLTAKVFRTYNATHTMQKQLDMIPNEGTVAEKLLAFNAANRAVAILCNHQRAIPKTHEASVGKMEEKILELQWERIRHKKMILTLEPTLKKKDPKYFAEINDLTKDTVVEIHNRILEREKTRIEKKFVRDNEKLKVDGAKLLPEQELTNRLEALDDMEKEFNTELKSGKLEVKGNVTVDKLRASVAKLDEKIANYKLQLKDKEDNSTVALGTSKTNYIDPRLTVMFSKKYDVPISKLFTKNLQQKFAWAVHSADENWTF
jgi:DNA topoisomerase-1